MTEKQLYTEIHNVLFKSGSCKPNVWQFVRLESEDGKVATFEAMLPSRGNIKIRKPIRRNHINFDNKEVWLYSLMRFTNKYELMDDGLLYDIRLDQQEVAQ